MSADLPRRWLHAGLVVACAAGLTLVVAAPWAAQRGEWAAPLFYALFDPLCHQIPERSFHLWGEPLAVCHRCTGLYLGFALGIVAWPSAEAAAARLLGRPRWVLAFIAPIAVDALVLDSTPASRFATGILAALPMALFALAAAAQLASGTCWIARSGGWITLAPRTARVARPSDALPAPMRHYPDTFLAAEVVNDISSLAMLSTEHALATARPWRDRRRSPGREAPAQTSRTAMRRGTVPGDAT